MCTASGVHSVQGGHGAQWGQVCGQWGQGVECVYSLSSQQCVHFTVCTMYRVYRVQWGHSTKCTVYSVYIVQSVQCTECSVYRVYSVYCTVNSKQ